ncbi:MAG TPA: ImmA/IrrE family metallo-endopeptidase [Pyrinomonadaceae bacterium]|nr:ImmA/IrrE family metallo-endopeptidase [Pyrinomonadaceae bacterium]HMP64807.1 ImmA/IrrE family metallo-endopeptidase [Pyrinomonadaceae bacterium]
MNYKKLAAQALTAALKVRSRAKADLVSPVCPYDICQELDISVKFVDVNMEGVYVREPKPRIVISALRPLARRNFTCGHELGHHVFGHSSNLDLLIKDREDENYDSPEEFLADSFSSFLLLPALGVRKAFASRSWNAASASPVQIYTVACNFGVGYATLVNHLTYSLNQISRTQAKKLLRSSPQTIREGILDHPSSDPLIIVDRHWLAPTADVEVGTTLLLPSDALPSNDTLIQVDDSPFPTLFRAIRTGVVRVSTRDNSWGIFVRIMPFQFQGLARYRHLEADEDD